MMPLARTALLALTLLAMQDRPSPLPGLPPPDVVAHRTTVLRDWVTAVERHAPGEQDAAFEGVSRWSSQDVETVWLDVQALLALIKDPGATRFLVLASEQRTRIPLIVARQELEALQDLAARLRQRYHPLDPFLHRAAVLHSDIAIAMQNTGGGPASSSMMTPHRVVVRTEDGQQVSMHRGLVHWEFGRLFLDAVREPSRDTFVQSWYRTTLAFKLWTEELDTPHFQHAQRVLRDDPVIRFQLGCLHEALADARVQTVVQTARLPRDTRLSVRSEREELREAERQFRGALEIDPTDVEARVRHGRTLSRLDRHKEASVELRLALTETQEPLLRYYAELFLAASEDALGRFPDARAAYERAAAIRPLAQAPKMGLSQLARRLGDRAAARTALEFILRAPASNDATHDPWWSYRFAPGRFTEDRLQAMYRLLSPGSPP